MLALEYSKAIDSLVLPSSFDLRGRNFIGNFFRVRNSVEKYVRNLLIRKKIIKMKISSK